MYDPDLMHDDYIEEAFWAALLALKDAVHQERGDAAVPIIAKWAGRKASTVYDWLERRSTPSKWQDIWRLSVRSSAEGFTEFASADVAATMRLSMFGKAVTNGTLRDELDQILRIGGELVEAESASNGQAIERLGTDLAGVADVVVEEGKRKQVQRTVKPLSANGH